MNDHTPNTAEVRACYGADRDESHDLRDAAFDRWLAFHDAQVGSDAVREVLAAAAQMAHALACDRANDPKASTRTDPMGIWINQRYAHLLPQVKK